MSAPIVSVVIPTYGRAQPLRECLEALSHQDLVEPWEIVVVDDGSPEPIAPLLKELNRGPFVRIVAQTNSGPAMARNRGVAEARGDYVAFIDDDCLPEPGWLRTLVAGLRENSNALIGGKTLNGLAGNFFATMNQFILDLVYEHFNSDPDSAAFMASNNLACGRKNYLKLGGFDAIFPRPGGEDREFCDRWRMQGWPLLVHAAARVEHRHHQSMREFIAMYVRYGRGAYLYQTRRRARGSGKIWDQISFHIGLPRRLLPRIRQVDGNLRRLKIIASLVLWQLGNAFGFGLEAAHQLLRPSRRRQGHEQLCHYGAHREEGRLER